MKKSVCLHLFLLLALILSVSAPAFAKDVNWIQGGKVVDVGTDFASLELPEHLMFLNKEDTVAFQSEIGNQPTSSEIGSIYPQELEEPWFVVIEYEEVGHIKDEDKNDIDADAILKSYKEGTEQQNEGLNPEEQIHVVGWDVAPFYDESTQTLQWSMLAEDNAKNPVINYNIQKLTRQGVVSFILVSDPSRLAQDKKTLSEAILPKFTLKAGNRYEDFDPNTDKVADYGLTGLVLGGLGLAIAKKAGILGALLLFLKKAWIFILIGAGALFKFVPRLLKKKQPPVEQPEDEQPHTPVS